MGYSMFTGQNIILPAYPGVIVAETAQVATAGTYYVSASAVLYIDPTDFDAGCYDSTSLGTLGSNRAWTTVTNNLSTLSIADALSVGERETIQLWCWSEVGSGNSYVFPYDPQLSYYGGAGITATLINSPFGASGKVGHSRKSSSRLKQRK